MMTDEEIQKLIFVHRELPAAREFCDAITQLLRERNEAREMLRRETVTLDKVCAEGVEADALRAALAEAREALEWYAAKTRRCDEHETGTHLRLDAGEKARAAIARIVKAMNEFSDEISTLRTKLAEAHLAMRRTRLRIARGNDEPAVADDPAGAAKSIAEASEILRVAIARIDATVKP